MRRVNNKAVITERQSYDSTLAGIPGMIDSSKAVTNKLNENFSYVTHEMDHVESAQKSLDYKPPPSAPAGTNGRNRKKLYTTLQPRPYKLVGDPNMMPVPTPTCEK